MSTRKLATAAAVTALLCTGLPVSAAFAQHGGHGGGGHGGGGHGGGGHGGGHGGGGHGGGGHGGGGFHGGGGHYGGGFHGGGHGYHGGDGGFGAGLVLGAILGNYNGHPYYCRYHRHWSPYYGRYVGGAC